MAEVGLSGLSASTSSNKLPSQTAGYDAKLCDTDINDNTNGIPSQEHMQDGVKQAEALTKSWTKKSLGLAYVL